MPVSNYPNGFAQGVVIRGTPIEIPHPGKVFWVNNSGVLPKDGVGGSNGNDGSYLKPFSTLDYAIGQCTANRGDVIYLMPGHSEAITAASQVDFDVAGITVIGLGYGTDMAELRATADVDLAVVVDAANIVLVNMRFTAGAADVGGTGWLDLNAGGFEMHNCIVDEDGGGENWVNFIVGAAVDDCKFHNNRCYWSDVANGSFLSSSAAMDKWEFIGNTMIMGTAQTTPAAWITGAAMTNWVVKHNDFVTQEDTSAALGVDSSAATCTGIYAFNTHGAKDADATGADTIDATGMAGGPNWASFANDTSGALIDADDLT